MSLAQKAEIAATKKAAELKKKLAGLKIKIIALAIVIIVGSLVLGIANIVLALSGSAGDLGSGCPYIPQSLGLSEPQAQTPLLYSMSNAIISILYSPSTTGQASGLLAKYRGAILDSTPFQVVRIFIFILVLSLIGVSFALGFTKLKAVDIIKRVVILMVFLWFTDNSNYKLYDEVIDPIATTWYKQISNIVNGAVAKAALNDSSEIWAYVENGKADNEFILLDATISAFFSRTIFDKMASLVFTNADQNSASLAINNTISVVTSSPFIILKMFTGLDLASFIVLTISIICYMIFGLIVIKFIFLAIEVTFFKIIIFVGLAIFPIFTLFIAVKALNNSMDQFSSFFSKFVDATLVKPGISIILLTLTGSIVSALILEQVGGAFSFYACVQRVFSSLPSLFGKFYYLIGFKPSSDEVFGLLTLNTLINIFSSEKIDILNLGLPDGLTIIALMIIPNLIMIAFLLYTFNESMNKTREYVSNLAPGSSVQGIGKELSRLLKYTEGKISKFANWAEGKIVAKMNADKKDETERSKNASIPIDKKDITEPTDDKNPKPDIKTAKKDTPTAVKNKEENLQKKDNSQSETETINNETNNPKPINDPVKKPTSKKIPEDDSVPTPESQTEREEKNETFTDNSKSIKVMGPKAVTAVLPSRAIGSGGGPPKAVSYTPQMRQAPTAETATPEKHSMNISSLVPETISLPIEPPVTFFEQNITGGVLPPENVTNPTSIKTLTPDTQYDNNVNALNSIPNNAVDELGGDETDEVDEVDELDEVDEVGGDEVDNDTADDRDDIDSFPSMVPQKENDIIPVDLSETQEMTETIGIAEKPNDVINPLDGIDIKPDGVDIKTDGVNHTLGAEDKKEENTETHLEKEKKKFEEMGATQKKIQDNRDAFEIYKEAKALKDVFDKNKHNYSDEERVNMRNKITELSESYANATSNAKIQAKFKEHMKKNNGGYIFTDNIEFNNRISIQKSAEKGKKKRNN